MNDPHYKTVDCVAWPPVCMTVELSGVLPSERLTPKMAERAARVAFGHRSGITVWDNEFHHGYRLYKNSARKLTN